MSCLLQQSYNLLKMQAKGILHSMPDALAARSMGLPGSTYLQTVHEAECQLPYPARQWVTGGAV